MDRSLTIIDNFFNNPDKIREKALQLHYYHDAKNNFPHKYSDEKLRRYVKEKLSYVLGVDIVRISGCHFRYAIANYLENIGSLVHTDDCPYAGIIHLTAQEILNQFPTGTNLVRHKATGLLKMPFLGSKDPIYRELLQKHYKGMEEAEALKAIEFALNESMTRITYDDWEVVSFIPAVFNRAVFYDGFQFHEGSSLKLFGDRVENARLTYNFFISEVKNKFMPVDAYLADLGLEEDFEI